MDDVVVSPGAAPARPDELLVIWGNTPWDGHRLGAQFLAEALARHHDVLYVDPPTSVVRLGRPGAERWRSYLRAGPEPVAEGVLRLRTVGPPGIRRTAVRPLTAALARRSLRRAVRHLDRPVRAVISGYLDAEPFGCCDERWRICRISDDFSTGTELGVCVDRMTRAQERIAGRADAVVCVSPPLVAQWRARGFDPVLVPNGSDTARLRAALDAPRPVAIRLPEPIVGYCGQLSRRVDLDLLEGVVEAGHSLLLVGGRRPEVDGRRLQALLDATNVQWLGERPYAEVPALLGAMAVGLLPYAASEFNRASFPLKLLEYLGAGVAPVATDLPAVRWLDTDLVRVATDRATFVAAVDAALTGVGDQVERERRATFASGHDWSRRAADYLRLLDQLEVGPGGTQSSGP